MNRTRRKLFAANTGKRVLVAASLSAFLLISTSSDLAQRPTVSGERAQANNLMKEGSTLYEQGTEASFRESLKKFGQAGELYRKIGNKRLEAASLQKIGEVANQLGENQQAIDALNKALAIRQDRRQKIVPYSTAQTLSTLCVVYFELGNTQRALEHCTQALAIWQAIRSKGDQAATLNTIGLIHTFRNEHDEALRTFIQSLALRKTAGDKTGEAITLRNIGSVYSNLRDETNSLSYFDQALELFKLIHNKTGEASTLSNIGKMYADLGETEKAIFYLNSALPIHREAGDVEREALTLSRLQDAWSAADKPSIAILFGKESVNKYQEMRSKIRGLDKVDRQTFLQTVSATYRKLAPLLISEGRIGPAEEVLAMLKEEEYFSYVRRDSSAASDLKTRASLTPREKSAFEAYEKFAPDVTAAAAEFGMLDKKRVALPLGQSLNAAEQSRYDELKSKYDAAIQVFNKFTESLKVKLGERDVRVAAIESDTVGLLKQLGEPRSAIISTIVGEEELNLIITTSDIPKAYTVKVKAEELNSLVGEFRAAVTNPGIDPRPSGKKLYSKLFPPGLQKDLANINADTIIWSLDGTLRYIPMAALWDGEKFLAERYAGAMITLASRDKLSSSGAGKVGWLVFGVGVSKKFETFNDLPGVPFELCSIVNDVKKREFCKALGLEKAGVIDGLLLPDEEFTQSSFRSNLGKTAVVHIASHFSLNHGNDADSYLLLGGGENRRFSLADLKETRLDKVDLLVLSACNTAMTAGDNSSGVEIEGFGMLAQKQGARSILATLWAVADESTALMVSEFYRIEKQDPQITKAAAMQRVQTAMIHGKIKSNGNRSGCRAETFSPGQTRTEFKCDPNAPFSHPFFWSPFVLIGNWR